MELWEVLVPAWIKPGIEYALHYHHKWDDQVRKIAGGLTVFPLAKGQWLCPKGTLHDEPMIPVRIACTKEQIEQISDLVNVHYNQKSVMYYRVSDLVVIKQYS